MKVFAIIALVLAVGYFGFARYQQLEKAKIEAAEAARIAAAEEKHRSDLALRVAAEERKRQDEEDALIAAEERFRASQQQKSFADAAQKKQQAVQAELTRKKQAKQLQLNQKMQELQSLNAQLTALENQIANASAARTSQYTNQRIQRLQQLIQAEERREKELQHEVLSRQKNALMMQCYAHCILRHQVDCRVQMGNETKRTLHGTYHKICPIPAHRRSKRVEYCKYYDKNGYWFVRFVCDKHRNSWTREKIAEFKDLYQFKRDEFVGSNARKQLRDCQQILSRRRAELRTLQSRQKKTPTVNHTLHARRAALNNQINNTQMDVENLKREISQIR